MENGISSAGWDLCRSERICRNRHSPPPKTVHACVYTQPPGGGKARAVGRRFGAGRLPPPLSLSLSLSLSTNPTPLHGAASWTAEAGGPLLVSGAYSVGRRRTNMRGARPAAPPKRSGGRFRPRPAPRLFRGPLLPASMSDGRTFSDENPIEAESEESVKSQ